MSGTSEAWRVLEATARRVPAPQFDPDAVSGEPAPIRRYLTTAITRGTPLAAGATLTMEGRIKIGRWLPFHARQILVPHHGTEWSASVAGVIRGSDHYAAGSGGMTWKLLGRVPIMRAAGSDVSRSAAERAAGESIWVPTAMLPSRDTRWSVGDDGSLAVVTTVDGHTVTVHYDVDDLGRLRSSHFARWGDPQNTKTYGMHPFGVEVTEHRTFGGVTIPAAGRAGWHFGTDRWPAGAFFEFAITHYELIRALGGVDEG